MLNGFTVRVVNMVWLGMTKWKKLSHTIYQCKYHIVFCPKYRYRISKDALADFLEQTIRMLCQWKNIEILEMNIEDDHIHHLYSSQIIGI